MAATQEELLFIMRMRDEATKVLEKHGKELKEVGETAKSSRDKLKELQKVATGVAAAVGGIVASTKLLRQTVGVYAQYEQGLLGVQKTTNLTSSEMATFEKRFDSLAKSMPVPIDQMQAIAQVTGQLGVQGVDNILAFTETVAKLGTASDLAGEEAATLLARMLNVFGEAPEEVGRLANVLVHLGNNSAATEREIARMAQEISLATATFDIGTTAASSIGAAMAELGLRAEISGTSVGRVFIQINDAVASGGDKLATFAKLAGLTSDQFKQLQQNDPTKAFLSVVKGLGEVIESGGNYTKILKDVDLQQLEINKTIVPLAKNYEKLAQKIDLGAQAAAEMTALDKEFNIFASSLNSLTATLGNNLQTLSKNIGAQLGPIVKSVFGAMIDVLQVANTLWEAMPEPIQTVLALLITMGPAVAGLIALVRVLTGAFALLGVTMRLTPLGALITLASLAGAALIGLTASTAGASEAQDGMNKASLEFERIMGLGEKATLAQADAVIKLMEADIAAARARVTLARQELDFASQSKDPIDILKGLIGNTRAEDAKAELDKQLAVIEDLDERMLALRYRRKALGTSGGGPGAAGEGLSSEQTRLLADFEKEIVAIRQETEALETGEAALKAFRAEKQIVAQIDAFTKSAEAAGLEADTIRRLTSAYREVSEGRAEATIQFEKIKEQQEHAKKLADELANTFTSSVARSITEANSFKEALHGIVKAMADVIIQAALIKPVANFLSGQLSGSGFTGLFSAQGNAFVGGDAVALAKGGAMHNGILKQPTAFKMRGGGMAFGGELDDEAILPLGRAANGDMGVKMIGGAGGGSVSINTTINVEGGSRGPEADTELATKISKELDSMISAKVSKELRNHMRPGNMLNTSGGMV